ncbi:MAG: hypothetical protein ACT4PM_08370 [Gemmatimonadales bacterium]
MRNVLRPLSFLVLGTVLSCSSDPVGPNEKPEEELVFLRFAGTAPPLESSLVTFWAVRGENREGRVFFLDEQGQRGDEFVRLRVDATSLLQLPDGLPIAPGDSVLITILVDPNRLLVTLLPAGLVFSSARPAELRIRYDKADPDYNDDGEVDSDDDDVEDRFAVWRQSLPGQPFVRLSSALFQSEQRVEASLVEFSRYAISY